MPHKCGPCPAFAEGRLLFDLTFSKGQRDIYGGPADMKGPVTKQADFCSAKGVPVVSGVVISPGTTVPVT